MKFASPILILGLIMLVMPRPASAQGLLPEPWGDTLIGAGLGAGLGALVGSTFGDAGAGAAIGAASGTLGGLLWSRSEPRYNYGSGWGSSAYYPAYRSYNYGWNTYPRRNWNNYNPAWGWNRPYAWNRSRWGWGVPRYYGPAPVYYDAAAVIAAQNNTIALENARARQAIKAKEEAEKQAAFEKRWRERYHNIAPLPKADTEADPLDPSALNDALAFIQSFSRP